MTFDAISFWLGWLVGIVIAVIVMSMAEHYLGQK